MEHTLRIKETTLNATPAVYKGIDLGKGNNIVRGMTTPALVRNLEHPKVETITFVYDTPHNRAFFLQREGIETAKYQDNQWVIVPKSWLKIAFADAVNAEGFEPAPPIKSIEEKKEPKLEKVEGIKGFEKIHKSKQKKALESLIRSEVPEDFRIEMLNNIVKSQNPNLANTVKDAAEEYLKKLALKA